MTPVRLRCFWPMVILAISGYAYGNRVKTVDPSTGRKQGSFPSPGDLTVGAADESSVEYVDEESLAPIYDFLIQLRLHKLCKLFRDAQLEGTLRDTGPLTIFAPTDGSFVFLPGGTLEEIQRNPQRLREFILHHIVAGDVSSQQIQDELIVTSLQGSPLRFNIYGSGQIYTVSGAQILEFDLPFELGRLHIIDHPLYPIPETDINGYVQSTQTEFYRLLLSTGLADFLSGGTYTVFVPDDRAFGYLSQDFLDVLHRNRTLAESILLNHVLHGSVYTRGITNGMRLESVGGAPLTFTESRGLTFANGVPIVLPDVPVTNGVIHIINRVLLPDDIDTDCHCKSSRTPSSGQSGAGQPQGPGRRPEQPQKPISRTGQPGSLDGPDRSGRPQIPGSSPSAGSSGRPGLPHSGQRPQSPGSFGNQVPRPGSTPTESLTPGSRGSHRGSARPGSTHQEQRPDIIPGRGNVPTGGSLAPGLRPQEPYETGRVPGRENQETQKTPGDNLVDGQPQVPGTTFVTGQAQRPGSAFGTGLPQRPGSTFSPGSPQSPDSSFGTGQPQAPGSTFRTGPDQRPGTSVGQPHSPGSSFGAGPIQRPGSGSGPGQPQAPETPFGTGPSQRPGSGFGPGQPHTPGSPFGTRPAQTPEGPFGTGQLGAPDDTFGTGSPQSPGSSSRQDHSRTPVTPQRPEGSFETGQPQAPGSAFDPGSVHQPGAGHPQAPGSDQRPGGPLEAEKPQRPFIPPRPGGPLEAGQPQRPFIPPRPDGSFGTGQQPQVPGSTFGTGSAQRPGTGYPQTGTNQRPGSTFGTGQDQRRGSHVTKGQTLRAGQRPVSISISRYPQRPGAQTPVSGAGEPQRPGSTGYLQRPESPLDAEQPQRPGDAGYPQRPESPVDAGQPQRPEGTGYPQRPDSSVAAGQPQRPGGTGYPQRPDSSVNAGQPQRPGNVFDTRYPEITGESGKPEVEGGQKERPGFIPQPGTDPVSPARQPGASDRTKPSKPGRIPLPPPPTRAPTPTRSRTTRYPGGQQRGTSQGDEDQFGGTPGSSLRGPYRPTRAPPTGSVSHGSRYPGGQSRVTPTRRTQVTPTYPGQPQDTVIGDTDQEGQPGHPDSPSDFQDEQRRKQPPAQRPQTQPGRPRQPTGGVSVRPTPLSPTQRPPIGQIRPVPTRSPVSGPTYRPIPQTTNCRQSGERITSSNRNLPLCSTEDVNQEPCQSLDQPYDPSDPRPACSDSDLNQGCRDPLKPPGINDRRPVCRVPQRNPNCREKNEPRDNRPLCPSPTRTCRLPEEPEDRFNPLPVCQEVFSVEGCRRPDDPYDPQDRRPECPPDDCRPPQEPLRPGDTRPLCTVNEEDSIRQPLGSTTAKPRYPQQPRPGSQVPQQPRPGSQVPQQPRPGSQVPQQPRPGSQVPQQPRPGSQVPQQPRPGSQVPQQPRPGSQVPQQPRPGSQVPQTPGEGQGRPAQQPPQAPSWQRPPAQPQPPRQPSRPGSPDTQKPGKQPTYPGSPVQPASPDDNDALLSPLPSPPGRPSYPGSSQDHRVQSQPSPGVNEPQSVGHGTSPIQPQGQGQSRPGRPHSPGQTPFGQGGTPQTSPRRPSSPGGRPTSQTGGSHPGQRQPIPQQPPRGSQPPLSPGSPATPAVDDSARSLLDIVRNPGLQIKGIPVKLTIILDLFETAGLVHILEGPGPATAFLPSDDAFKKLPRGVVEQLAENPELLRQVLLYHVLAEEVRPTAQETSITVPTLQGMNLVITMLKEGRLILIGGAKAVAVTRANNGIFYVINELLYPLPHEDIVSALKSRPDLTEVTSLIERSGLTNMLTGRNPFTFFAPTDLAFGQLPEDTRQAIVQNNTAVQELLLGHIVEGAHFGREFLAGGVFPNARGGKLRFKVLSYGYTVNDANIKTPEIVTGTGVIHLVDQVLLEPDDFPSIQEQPQHSPAGGVSVARNDVPAGNQENYPEIADLARGMGLNRFLSWITNTGIIDMVHDGGSYTILAPTDEAVNSLPASMVEAIDTDPEQVRPLLKFHVITQHIDLNSIRNDQTVSTLLQDKRIRFNVYPDGQGQVVTACGVPIGQAQGSGPIRLIAVNQPLYPPSGNLGQVIEASPILQNLAKAIRSFHLSWMLTGQGPTTIFAPSDAAFDALSDEEKKNLIENRQAFTDLLKRHIVKGSIYSNGIEDGMQVRNEKREMVTFSVHPGGISINSIPISYTDITATNGVLHVIDHFL